MAIHWQIPFKSLNETSYVVNIYDDDYAGDPVTLKGAEVPFETQDEDLNDPFAPICYSTGYINIVVTDNADVEGILPTDTKDRFVELVSGTDILWQGYVKCEQYDGEWDATPYQLSLPVISAVGVLQYMEFDGIPETLSLGTLIGRCIEKTGANYERAYLPASYSPEDIRATIQTLAFLVQENKEKAYVIGDDIPEPDMKMSWYEVLEEWCKYFGVQLHEFGKYIVLSASDSTQRYHLDTFYVLQRGTIGANARNLPTLDLPAIGGSDGNISRSLPMQQVRISTPLTLQDRELIRLNDLKYLYWEDTISGTYNYAYYEGNPLIDDDFIKTYMYSFSGGRTTPYVGIKRNLIYDTAGGTPTAFDNFTNEDPDKMLLQGGCCASDTMSPKGGKTPCITITGTSYTQFQQENSDGTYTMREVGFPAVEIMTRTIYGNLGVTELQLWADIATVGWDSIVSEDLTVPQFYYIITFHPIDGSSVLYYNDLKEAWQTAKAYALFAPGLFHSAGVAIPIVNAIGRYKVTICTYKHKDYYTDKSGQLVLKANPKFLRFRDFTLKTIISDNQANVEERYDLDSIERVKITGANSNEMYKQEQMLFCNNDLISRYPDYKVHSTYCGIDAPNKLWADILERMNTWYTIPRESVEVTLQSAMINAANRLQFQGEEYIIGAQNINWRNNTNRIKLYKL